MLLHAEYVYIYIYVSKYNSMILQYIIIFNGKKENMMEGCNVSYYNLTISHDTTEMIEKYSDIETFLYIQ